MKMRALALTGAALLAALPLTAGTADAAAKCPKGNICGWAKPNFGVMRIPWSAPPQGATDSTAMCGRCPTRTGTG